MIAEAAAAVTNQHHALGQTYALLTALLWGFALVLFKLAGERVAPVALNLYKNAVGLVLLIVTLVVLIVWEQNGLNMLRQYCLGDVCLLLLSGVIGLALADTIFFHALNLIGVGLISIVDCVYSPFVILFSWILLREQLALVHYGGAGLIVVGVLIASRHRLPASRTRGQIILGMLLAMLAVALMAFGIVITKPILEGSPLIWATALRVAAGVIFLGLFALLGRKWKAHWTIFRPSDIWRIALPASILGTYICMIFWVAGFKYTYASIAGVLNQTSVIFGCVFAALILKEHFGARKVAALVLALIGVVIVTLGDRVFLLLGAP
ncbi:MAG: DMT family transporter [Phycisphaerae bacterium]|nr:DMT family transporter [Phycisphaerae bacterium]